MKKKIISGVCLLMSVFSLAAAESAHTLYINGEKVDKVVSKITFDGDYVVLHFGADTERHDMESVSLAFNQFSGVDAINMFQFTGVVGNTLSITGATPGSPVQIYNLSGMTVFEAVASGEADTFDVSQLPAGLYIMRAGDNCIKFVKR